MERGRGGDRPRAIVLHTTAGSFAGTDTWFADPDSNVSAHFVVALDGRVAQFVDERDTARHAGRVRAPTASLAVGEQDVNRFTIGIEFEDGGDPAGVTRPDAQYEAGGWLIADLATRWGIPLDRDHVMAHREVFAAKSCPGNLDLERLLTEARGRAGDAVRGTLLLCLLPARDAEPDLPGYLESVKGLAPVVALDDGSADATAQTLEASFQVVKVLRNPPRESFAGWDDAANRRRLLEAAAELDPQWVLFLDADERIDPDDARALRDFLTADAIPGLAYGLQLFRTWGEVVERRPIHVYRLFAFEPGQVLPGGQLHFNPVPDDIPRSAWVRTTIRIRHLDSPERRDGRWRKYLQADPAGRFERLSRRLLDDPAGPFEEWKPRPARLPVLSVQAPADRAADSGAGRRGELTLACLLPARNCEADLPGYFESVSRFADAVIALDDGSTDGTATALEAEPLVRTVLRNPPREGYAEWDDAANRQRLLEAAASLDPEWVLFLDADERIDADDARALRDFLELGADPEHAYGFQVHRMVGDEDHYDRAELWVYRLFAFEPGRRLPEDRLHLVPVPNSIPRDRWRRTTLRIQHLASLTEERRLERLRKYEQADPELRWQREYERTLLDIGPPRDWKPRPPELPVLADPVRNEPGLDLEELDLDAPVLSAIVISRNDEKTIERSVRSVVEQECPVRFEVIVVVSGSDRTADVVRERFPGVTLVELPGPTPPGRARNAGLAAARGEYVSFPGSHVELSRGSLAARVRAHEQGWAMVTGSIVNGTRTRAGWASYFLDHSSSLPGRPSGPLAGAPAHCSYVREFLIQAGGFPDDVRAGEDTIVNEALWRAGHRAFREREIRLTHKSPCRGPARLVRHHFVRGRAYGRVLRGDHRPGGPHGRPPLRFLTAYPGTRLTATDSRVVQWGGELTAEYRRARPFVVLGTLSAWAGLCFEVAVPRRGRSASTSLEEPQDREAARVPGPSGSG
jgi:glycosyltransferase involved in cell wall biosynthesis